ncbi:MAG: DUF5615 family PIN-like protein [Chloroflexi bacterium]|nr:DUF5615 family PIN-like protein [Chloroflexota bacterium]
MRLLLDAHVSSRHLGRPLRRAGHDVLALDQDPTLGSLADEDVFALAAEAQRIVVTHNIRDFAPLARIWAEASRPHAGCVPVTLPHTAYGAILRGLAAAFAGRPKQDDWRDRVELLTGPSRR